MIHQFHAQGYSFVVDTYSGAIHLLDPLAEYAISWIDQQQKEDLRPIDAAQDTRLFRAMTHAFPDASTEDIETTLRDLAELIQTEQLFTEDPYADLSLKLRDRKTYVKALCLNVAHTCNLDCDYCFASQGKYHGARALMSLEVAQRAIDFVIEASGPHRNIDIDFFGGEPALNWDVVKETVRYARSKEEAADKHFRFTFTTNGMLLDEEMSQFLNENMHNVVLSLDGRQEVHDRLRHTVDGRGSYERIVPRFQSFVEARGDQEYYMRGTYTKNNVDFSNDVIHMANLGFYRLSMEPVIGDPSEPYMLSEEDIPTLEREYEKLAEEMIRRDHIARDVQKNGGSLDDIPPEDHPFVFYHFMMNLEGGPCVHKRISGCGSGTEYMAVTPNGDLYPCHQFVGENDFKIGDVWHGIEEPDITASFKECNCYSRPDCQDCWAKLFCSGGCAANAHHAAGDLKGTVPLSCALFQKRVECALAIKAAQALDE